MRKKLIEKVQRTADLPGTKLPAHEVSRVARLVLDEVDEAMQKLFVGIYWDFHKTKGGEASADKVMKLTHKLEELVQRARRKRRGSGGRGKAK